MASIAEQIIDAVIAALDAVGKPAGLTIHDDPTVEFSGSSTLKEIVVDPVNESVDSDSDLDGNVDRELLVRLHYRVAGGRSAVDPLRVWAIKRMRADPTFGGLALSSRERSTTWLFERSDAPYGAAVTEFSIQFHTPGDDPEATGD